MVRIRTPIAPPCRLSAKARCEPRLRHANTSAANAAAAMPASRNSTGTRSQPESAAYLSRAPTPRNSTITPTFTGTLPSLNHCFTRRNARVSASGRDGTTALAGTASDFGGTSASLMAGASATGKDSAPRCAEFCDEFATRDAATGAAGVVAWGAAGIGAARTASRPLAGVASVPRSCVRLRSTSARRRRACRNCPSKPPRHAPIAALVQPVGSSNTPAHR